MSITQVTGMMQTGTKGGDIPSASTLVIDVDGDMFDITGTTQIDAMTVAAGRRFTLQFDGALTLAHGSSLYLPGAVNFVTEANDTLSFIATAANTVRCTGYALKDGGSPVAAAGGEDGLTNNSNTTWLTVSADEEVNMPLQPCFLAQRTSTVSNVTGNGGAYTIPFDVEIFDIGSNYATTGIFTAPITGKYIFTTFYYATGMASRTSIESQFVTSNRKHRMVTFNADDVGASSMVLGGSCIADMDASDTCYINLQCYSSSDTVDVYGDGSNGYTYFSGCLLV